MQMSLDRYTLRSRAGMRSFSQGQAYFETGAVSNLRVDGAVVHGHVQGTELYTVSLTTKEDGSLRGECTCLYAMDKGRFCKHCVALGLACLEQRSGDKVKQKPLTAEDLRDYLLRQDVTVLVGLIMEQSQNDRTVYDRLLMEVAQSDASGPNLATIYKAIDRAVETDGYVSYKDAYAYAQRIDQVASTIRKLLADGYADPAAELAEYALDALDAADGYVDDSSGYIGGCREDLWDLHFEGCVAGAPDPEALATWLYRKEVAPDASGSGMLARYADVLGEEGIDFYRRLAWNDWEALPRLAPGQDDPEKFGRRYRLTRIIEALAQHSGDVDDIVAVKCRDLSGPDRFLDVARTYLDHGKEHEALEWAQRGVSTFPNDSLGSLSAFLVEQYRLAGRDDDALSLLWKRFEKWSDLYHFQPLKAYAIAREDWTDWRYRAISLLRESLEARGIGRTPSRYPPTSASELVRILLWDGDVDAAWNAARTSGCNVSLWMELAAAREELHPEDAIPIYRERVEPALEHVNNGQYDEAVRLVAKMGELMKRVGCDAEFEEYVRTLRAEYKRKRNFIKLLDSMKL